MLVYEVRGCGFDPTYPPEKKKYNYRNTWNLIKTAIIIVISKSGQDKTVSVWPQTHFSSFFPACFSPKNSKVKTADGRQNTEQ